MNKFKKMFRNQRGESNALGLVIVCIMGVVLLMIAVMIGGVGNVSNAVALLQQQGYTVLGPGVPVGGDILPSVNNTYNIGSTVFEWKNGWFGQNITANRGYFSNVTVGDTLNAKTGRTSTYTVAASNSGAYARAQADYVCDGTNDHVEINAAILADNATGGTVHLFSGTYNLGTYNGDGAINLVEVGNITLEGEGTGTVLNCPLEVNIIDAQRSGGLTIRNLKIVGAGVYHATMDGLDFDDCYNCTVEYVTLSGASDIGINFAGNTDGVITAYNNRALYNDITGSTDAINLYNSYYSVAIGNRISSPTHNGIDCMMNGLGTTPRPHYNIIRDNIITSPTSAGIYTSYTQYLQVINNQIMSAGGYGISIDSGSDYINYTGNNIVNPTGLPYYFRSPAQNVFLSTPSYNVSMADAGSQTLTPAGRVHLTPYLVKEPSWFNRIYVQTGATAVGNMILGVYSCNTTTLTPLTLLVQSANTTVGVGASAIFSVTVNSTSVSPGWYYIAIESDNTTCILNRAASPSQVYGAAAPIFCYNYDRGGGYGALTTPCPALTNDTNASIRAWLGYQ